MRSICECGEMVKWIYLGEQVDERGARWEVYRCPECGATRRYCVA